MIAFACSSPGFCVPNSTIRNLLPRSPCVHAGALLCCGWRSLKIRPTPSHRFGVVAPRSRDCVLPACPPPATRNTGCKIDARVRETLAPAAGYERSPVLGLRELAICRLMSALCQTTSFLVFEAAIFSRSRARSTTRERRVRAPLRPDPNACPPLGSFENETSPMPVDDFCEASARWPTCGAECRRILT